MSVYVRTKISVCVFLEVGEGVNKREKHRREIELHLARERLKQNS